MSVLKVTTVTDLAGLGGFTLSSGSIVANGTLKVDDININGNITGTSSYNVPSFSGQSGRFLSTDGTNLIWSNDIASGGGGGGGYGDLSNYGSHHGGVSYMGGSQAAGHNQDNYSHQHQSHCAWGAGGNGSQFSNRGARGREGVVVVYEYYG